MKAYLLHNCYSQVLALFEGMIKEGLEPDGIIYNTVIKTYIRMGDIASAKTLLRHLEQQSRDIAEKDVFGRPLPRQHHDSELGGLPIWHSSSYILSSVYEQFINYSLHQRQFGTALAIFFEMLVRGYLPSHKVFENFIFRFSFTYDCRVCDFLIAMYEYGHAPSPRTVMIVMDMLNRYKDERGIVRVLQIFVETGEPVEKYWYIVENIANHLIERCRTHPQSSPVAAPIKEYPPFEPTHQTFISQKLAYHKRKTRVSDILDSPIFPYIPIRLETVTMPPPQRLAQFWLTLATNVYLRKHVNSKFTSRVIEVVGKDAEWGLTLVREIWRILSVETRQSLQEKPHTWADPNAAFDYKSQILWKGAKRRFQNSFGPSKLLQKLREIEPEMCDPLRPTIENYMSLLRVLFYWERYGEMRAICNELSLVGWKKTQVDAVVGEVVELLESKGMHDIAQMIQCE